MPSKLDLKNIFFKLKDILIKLSTYIFKPLSNIKTHLTDFSICFFLAAVVFEKNIVRTLNAKKINCIYMISHLFIIRWFLKISYLNQRQY